VTSGVYRPKTRSGGYSVIPGGLVFLLFAESREYLLPEELQYEPAAGDPAQNELEDEAPRAGVDVRRNKV